ncbi:MAG: hypothetical protein AB7S55_00810 [Thiomonas sp.]
MSAASALTATRLRPLLPPVGAAVCWLLQYASVQRAAPQVAPLFQASVAVAWAMLLLWLWTRWRGIALFAQGTSLLAALRGGMLFTLQWACLYLAVDRLPLWLVAASFALTALLAVRWPAAMHGAVFKRIAWAGVLLLGAWAWLQGQTTAWLLTLLAAGCLAAGLPQSPRAADGPHALLRWRFYQLCIAALLLPLLAVAFSPSWTFDPGWGALGAMLLQAVCGGLVFAFLLCRLTTHPE